MKFALDLTWIRHKHVGGTESFAHNLVRGLIESEGDFQAYLLIPEINMNLYEEFKFDKRFELISCDVDNSSVLKRMIWQNTKLEKLLKQLNVKLLFEPVYDKPMFLSNSIKTVAVIHDIQAIHYPQFQSLKQRIRQRIVWKADSRHCNGLIFISQFSADDFLEHYKVKGNVHVIHNPIIIDECVELSFEELRSKYELSESGYFYTTGTNANKNIETLVRFMNCAIQDAQLKDYKLLISGGISNNAKGIIENIKGTVLENKIIFTGFVSNEERNALLRNCACFLFPSIFEGFGMPPVEALMVERPTVTTRLTSLPEVTMNKAIYVDDPYSAEEWIVKVKMAIGKKMSIDKEHFSPKHIAEEYLSVLEQYAE